METVAHRAAALHERGRTLFMIAAAVAFAADADGWHQQSG
jgi:uncharacterized protein (DUF1778 family)